MHVPTHHRAATSPHGPRLAVCGWALLALLALLALTGCHPASVGRAPSGPPPGFAHGLAVAAVRVTIEDAGVVVARDSTWLFRGAAGGLVLRNVRWTASGTWRTWLAVDSSFAPLRGHESFAGPSGLCVTEFRTSADGVTFVDLRPHRRPRGYSFPVRGRYGVLLHSAVADAWTAVAANDLSRVLPVFMVQGCAGAHPGTGEGTLAIDSIADAVRHFGGKAMPAVAVRATQAFGPAVVRSITWLDPRLGIPYLRVTHTGATERLEHLWRAAP